MTLVQFFELFRQFTTFKFGFKANCAVTVCDTAIITADSKGDTAYAWTSIWHSKVFTTRRNYTQWILHPGRDRTFSMLTFNVYLLIVKQLAIELHVQVFLACMTVRCLVYAASHKLDV